MFDPARLYRLIEDRTEQLVGILRDLLRFETVSGVKEPAGLEKFERETRRCLDYLRKFAEDNGLEYREHPAGVAVIEWGEGEEAIGFPTHTDVVPPGAGWHYPPFGGEVRGERIYGRGAQDDKGPMACGLAAILAIRDLGVPARRKVRLIFGTHEEEGDWSDITAYLRSEPPPLHCIVPDAVFPIVNGEKGMATILLKPARTEPLERKDGLRLERVRSGERPNVVPNRAEVELSGPLDKKEALCAELKEECEAYEKSRIILLEGPLAVRESPEEKRFYASLVFRGKSAHGSRPEQGHNAAVDALGYLVRLGFRGSAAAEFLGLAYCAGKDLTGEYLGIAEWHEFIGPTTASLNIFELDGEGGQAQINVRFPLGLASAELIERVRREVAAKVPQADRRPTVEFEGVVHEPLFTDPEKFPEFFDALRQAYSGVTGREARLQATGGTTYAKGFPRAVSFGPVDEGAGERDMAHKADEYVALPALVRNAKIYAHALAALALR